MIISKIQESSNKSFGHLLGILTKSLIFSKTVN